VRGIKWLGFDAARSGKYAESRGLPDLRIDESFGARLAYSFSLSFV
jgi:hypothetical protein